MSIEAQEVRILTVAAWITGIIAVIWCVGIISGCNTILPAVIDAATNTPPAAVTNLVPVVKKPVTTSCGCDLSKPPAIFASPVHGQDEAAVGAWLRQRWVDGFRDHCDGLPQDVRPNALNPSGRGPFNWKYGITDGRISIKFDGKGNMMLGCGDVPVDGQVQRWHFVGTTDLEEGRKGADFKEALPNEWTPKKHRACFDIRNK